MAGRTGAGGQNRGGGAALSYLVAAYAIVLLSLAGYALHLYGERKRLRSEEEVASVGSNTPR